MESTVIVSIALVFVFSVAGGLLAIVGIAVEIVQRIKRLVKKGGSE